MGSPFAMVGRHPSCQIRINKLSTPDLVYIVFSFKETIEVWPTAAIAFPQWGPLAADQPLMVGGTRLYFEQHKNENSSSDRDHRSCKKHVLDVDGGPRQKKRSVLLDHRVQIVGGNHPSTIRIRDVGLSTCEQAIVGFDECCWQINLRQNIIESDRVKQIFVNDGMRIGKLNASYRTKNGKAKESSSRFTELVSSKPAAHKSLNGAVTTETFNPDREDGPGDVVNKIAEKVTDRLVTLNRTRTLRSKAIKWGVWLLMAATAASILAWIASKLTL